MRTLHVRWAVVFALAISGPQAADTFGQGTGGAIPARTQINQGNAQPRGNQPAANQPRANQPARPPQGWEITQQQQKWIDQILRYWEARSDQVDRFSCKFERWEYNPAFIQDPKVHWTQAAGEIKFEKPDKAVYRVTDLQHYQAPRAQGERPSYVRREDAPGEYWVCDGQAIYEFDHRNKNVIQRTLPPQMQGAAIADGPLPFLFGAKAAKLKQRYWFKPLTPPKDPKTGQYVQGEYWLAAKPKTLQDAQNYEVVELIIDQKEFLPIAMQIYMPGGHERKVFKFAERTVNPRQRFWEGNFIRPDVPRGWKMVRDDPAPARSGNGRVGQRGTRGGSQIPVAQRR